MALHSLSHDKYLRIFIQSNPEISMSEIEKFYNNTLPVVHSRVDSKLFIFDVTGGDFDIIKCEDIRWVFCKNINMRVMGLIPAGTARKINIYTKDGIKHELKIGGISDKAQTELLKYIYPYMTNALFGYSDKFVKLWNEDHKRQNGYLNVASMGRMQHLNRREY